MGVEEKKLAKKIGMINAAYELFGSKGVNLTAVDEVVKLAGVAKGTFYLYFKDKYDLLDQIILAKSEKIFIAAMETATRAREEKNLSPADTLIAFTDEILAHLGVDKALVRLLQRNLPSFQALVMARSNDRLSETAARLVDLFGTVAEDRASAEKLLYIYISMLGSVCCDCILTGVPYSIGEIRPQLYAMIRRLFLKEKTGQ